MTSLPRTCLRPPGLANRPDPDWQGGAALIPRRGAESAPLPRRPSLYHHVRRSVMADRSSGTGRRAGARSATTDPSLSDLDHRILDLLSFLRVLTLPQLASLSPETPPRTLRYRAARLAKHGFVGRTRPYRERGSAPHHLWPTRKGEAIANGEPPPRGGERREPNPLFLAHAAGLSELYVVLKTRLPEGTRLAAFDRETDARETFTTYAREERAIAPDACIDVAETDGRRLLGFAELDLGTMSHRQLKAKAAGYGEYVQLEAWRERNPFCPALLFITTSEKRARSFLAPPAGRSTAPGCWSPASGWPATFGAASPRPSGWSAKASSASTCSTSSAPLDGRMTKRRSAKRPSAARKRRSASGCALTPRPSPSACGESFATPGETISWAERRPMPFASQSKARAG